MNHIKIAKQLVKGDVIECTTDNALYFAKLNAWGLPMMRRGDYFIIPKGKREKAMCILKHEAARIY